MSSCRAAADARDGRGVLEPIARGQLKFSRMGNYCVSAAGEIAGRNVAMGSKVVATSAQLGHPAGNAVDGWGRFSTYWASALDPSVKAPVDLTLDFGVSVDVASIEVHWELPAKARPRCARALL